MTNYYDLNEEKIINDYKNGSTMYSIAKEMKVTPGAIRNRLIKNGIELRESKVKRKDYASNEIKQMLKWLKSQDRLVTREELAKAIGRNRVPVHYFDDCPELTHYLKPRQQSDIAECTEKLYKWLNEHEIKFKANDRTKIGINLHAVLLDEYDNIALHLDIKPNAQSKNSFKQSLQEKIDASEKAGVKLILLTLDDVKCNFKGLQYALID